LHTPIQTSTTCARVEELSRLVLSNFAVCLCILGPAAVAALPIHTEQDMPLTTAMCFADAVLDKPPGGNLEVQVADVDHRGLQDEEKRGEGWVCWWGS
jgi:hypothetical protein